MEWQLNIPKSGIYQIQSILGKRLSLSTEFKKGHIYYGKRKHLEFDTNS